MGKLDLSNWCFGEIGAGLEICLGWLERGFGCDDLGIPINTMRTNREEKTKVVDVNVMRLAINTIKS